MPAIKHNALSAAQVRSLKIPGVYTDGNGLTLRVEKTGSKHWVQRIRVDGKQRNLGLGGYPAVSLADARGAALDNFRAVKQGNDVIAAKQDAKEERRQVAAIPCFKDAAETVIEMRRPTWSNDRHAEQWTQSIEKHAIPLIGNKRLDSITTADVLEVLTPIWTCKAETATRVRQRLETIFDWVIAQGWRQDNPAGRAVVKALPKTQRLKEHHPALPYKEIPAALQAVRESTADAVTRLSFEFLALTATRAGEVRLAEWSEIDRDSRTWEIPASRMKARRPHRVPLSGRAMEILEQAKALCGQVLIFPNKRSGKPLSNMAYSVLLQRLNIPAVPHGFRSTFKDWTLEMTATPWAVSEAALAHTLGNSMTAAYARTDLFDKRRELMQQWADFLTG